MTILSFSGFSQMWITRAKSSRVYPFPSPDDSTLRRLKVSHGLRGLRGLRIKNGSFRILIRAIRGSFFFVVQSPWTYILAPLEFST